MKKLARVHMSVVIGGHLLFSCDVLFGKGKMVNKDLPKFFCMYPQKTLSRHNTDSNKKRKILMVYMIIKIKPNYEIEDDRMVANWTPLKLSCVIV